MNSKFLLAVLCVGGFVLYLTGCSKTSEDRLTGGNTVCDTTNIKYSVDIVNILSDNCYECHKGAGIAASGSGVDLGSYTGVLGHVNNGDIRSAITHDGRVTPMPYQRPQLQSCEIEKILAWINAGAPNN